MPPAHPHLTLPALPALCSCSPSPAQPSSAGEQRALVPWVGGTRGSRVPPPSRPWLPPPTATSLKAQGLACPSMINHGLSGCPTLRPAPRAPLRKAGWAPGSPFGGPRTSEGSYLISLPNMIHFWGPHPDGGAPGARPQRPGEAVHHLHQGSGWWAPSTPDSTCRDVSPGDIAAPPRNEMFSG